MGATQSEMRSFLEKMYVSGRFLLEIEHEDASLSC